jgi:hypothetical protein
MKQAHIKTTLERSHPSILLRNRVGCGCGRDVDMVAEARSGAEHGTGRNRRAGDRPAPQRDAIWLAHALVGGA